MIRKLPIHALHERHGAHFGDFAGWSMPLYYSSIREEHEAVRSALGLFDVTHMGEILVNGPGAEAYLNYLLTCNLGKVRPGRSKYGIMCNPEGGTIDDVIVYRRGGDDFLVCVNAGNREADFEWMCVHAPKFDVDVSDASDDFALLALQGPAARDLFCELSGDPAVRGIKRFGNCMVSLLGAEVLVARTGYTGEDGFEIFMPVAEAETIADALMAAGESAGIKLCGLGARDSLRLEAGMPLYGHELAADISPLQTGLDFAVDLSKDDFIGKAALDAQMAAGPDPVIIFFTMEGRRIARDGAEVYSGDQRVGTVRSGTQSPTLGKPIGSALVSDPAVDKALEVDIRGKRYPIARATPPLHRPT